MLRIYESLTLSSVSLIGRGFRVPETGTPIRIRPRNSGTRVLQFQAVTCAKDVFLHTDTARLTSNLVNTVGSWIRSIGLSVIGRTRRTTRGPIVFITSSRSVREGLGNWREVYVCQGFSYRFLVALRLVLGDLLRFILYCRFLLLDFCDLGSVCFGKGVQTL